MGQIHHGLLRAIEVTLEIAIEVDVLAAASRSSRIAWMAHGTCRFSQKGSYDRRDQT